MKSVKVWFEDFEFSMFDRRENWIMEFLEKHYDVILTEEEPDYLFSGSMRDDYLNYDKCIRIYVTAEALCPNFNLFDYAVGFDHLSFGDRYFRLPNYYYLPDDIVEYALYRQPFTMEDLKKKEEFATFVVSNPGGAVQERFVS